MSSLNIWIIIINKYFFMFTFIFLWFSVFMLFFWFYRHDFAICEDFNGRKRQAWHKYNRSTIEASGSESDTRPHSHNSDQCEGGRPEDIVKSIRHNRGITIHKHNTPVLVLVLCWVVLCSTLNTFWYNEWLREWIK